MADQSAKNYNDALKKLQAVIIADSFENKFVPLSNSSNP